jgi:hypothetical protein
MSEVADIQKLVETLHYSEEPNYERIEDLLVAIFNNYTVHRSESDRNKFEAQKRKFPIFHDAALLKKHLKEQRSSDLALYFNNHPMVRPRKQGTSSAISHEIYLPA